MIRINIVLPKKCQKNNKGKGVESVKYVKTPQMHSVNTVNSNTSNMVQYWRVTCQFEQKVTLS